MSALSEFLKRLGPEGEALLGKIKSGAARAADMTGNVLKKVDDADTYAGSAIGLTGGVTGGMALQKILGNDDEDKNKLQRRK